MDSKHGVLCCSMNGEICTSEHELLTTNEKCHNATFTEAKIICENKEEKGSFRLCLPEELDSCCNRGCEQHFDDQTVWVETSAKGTKTIRDIL